MLNGCGDIANVCLDGGGDLGVEGEDEFDIFFEVLMVDPVDGQILIGEASGGEEQQATIGRIGGENGLDGDGENEAGSLIHKEILSESEAIHGERERRCGLHHELMPDDIHGLLGDPMGGLSLCLGEWVFVYDLDQMHVSQELSPFQTGLAKVLRGKIHGLVDVR